MSARRRRIAILREPERAEPLRAALVGAGFEVVVQPLTRIVSLTPPMGADWPAWTAAADWVVFTSLNGVQGFAQGLGGDDALAKVLAGRRVAVLGAASAQKLEVLGVRADVLEEHGRSAELATALLAAMAPESTVLYFCAEETLPTLSRALRAAGHRLRQVACYRTRPLSPGERMGLDWGALDAALVAAPSAVRALHGDATLPAGFGFFAIGPTTAAALRDAGLAVLGVSPSPKVESIAAMLADYYDG
jgi:uroporphyrinogen III methyltransferase/synthase